MATVKSMWGIDNKFSFRYICLFEPFFFKQTKKGEFVENSNGTLNDVLRHLKI